MSMPRQTMSRRTMLRLTAMSAAGAMAAACVALFVTYTRLLGRAAGAPSDFCGPMDKGGRMIVLMLAALYMGLAPADWLPAGDAWGAMVIALLVVCLGGAYTAARRLTRAARFLHQAG